MPWPALLLVAGCNTAAPQDTLPALHTDPAPAEKPSRPSGDDDLAVFAADMLFESLAVGAGPGMEIESLIHTDGGTLSIGVPLAAEAQGVLTLRAGLEFVDSDSGEHDQEQGVGAGVGLGYRHYFGWNREGWLLGGRLDFWVAELDWEDDLPGGGKLEGRSDVVVLRPGLEAGYSLWISDTWRIEWLTTLGLDLYLATDGEDVGSDNLRLAVGIAFRYGF